MRRLIYMATLAIVATLMLAPGATAQQMYGKHMMPNGQMMDDNMMASPSAPASATSGAAANRQMKNGNMMASPSASASAATSASTSPSATASATPTASAAPTVSASRSHHHGGGGGSSASAAVGGSLPSTGGVPFVWLVSVGALALLVGFGLAAHRLLRRSA